MIVFLLVFFALPIELLISAPLRCNAGPFLAITFGLILYSFIYAAVAWRIESENFKRELGMSRLDQTALFALRDLIKENRKFYEGRKKSALALIEKEMKKLA